MYDIRNLPGNKHLCAVGLVLLGSLCSVQVKAQSATVPDAAFQRFMWTTTGANSQSVTVGTGGIPVASPTGSGTISADGTKSLNYSRNSTWRNGSGNTVAGTVGGKIPINPKTARLLTSGMKIIPLLGNGIALWEMAKEIGYDVKKGPDGELVVGVNDPTICTTAPCFNFRVNSGYQWNANPETACKAWVAANPPRTFVSVTGSGATRYCVNKYGASPDNAVTPMESLSVSPSAPSTLPSSITALEDAIAEKAGWPSSSKLPSALRDAATATGQTIDVEAPKITGPATSPGTTTTTSNPTAGTTTTNTTTHNHTYNDNRVTNTITTSSNVTNNGTGQTTTTTTTEQPVEEIPECEKNPSSLNCADLDTPKEDISKTKKTITFNAENLGFAGGSCPANVTQNINGAPLVLFNWTSHCTTIVNYAKPMILALATFAALMIIFGAKTE